MDALDYPNLAKAPLTGEEKQICEKLLTHVKAFCKTVDVQIVLTKEKPADNTDFLIWMPERRNPCNTLTIQRSKTRTVSSSQRVHIQESFLSAPSVSADHPSD